MAGDGADRVRRGHLRTGSLAGCFIASILKGMVQTFSVVMEWSFADMLRPLGISVSADDPGESSPFRSRGSARWCPMLLIVILLFRPRGLMGTRET
jgi:branched-chain amino acid transport system permease protein